MIVQRTILILIVAVMTITATQPIGPREAIAQTDSDRLSRLKAAYLLNFIKYTQWPASSFENERSSLVVTVVGRCDLLVVLDEVFRRASPVHGRSIELRIVRDPLSDVGGRATEDELDSFYDGLRQSHVVYMCSLDTSRVRAILREVEGRNILTTGDIPRYANVGGMLGLTLRENHLKVQANLRQIRKTGLVVSAKLLNVAEIVEE